MNIGFKIAVFMICVNIAAGIMSTALPDLPIVISYTSEEQTKIEESLTNVSVDPSGGAGSEPATFGDRVLDFIHLGWIKNVTSFLYSFLFGFSGLLEKIFGSYYQPYKTFVNLGISTAYALSIIMLWLGRKLN